MCLIAFAWRADDRFPLVVAANRDEFFARPAEPAHWWPDRAMLAGRDLRAGGTWMGVSAAGRFAALTNYRDPGAQRPDAPSRGALVEACVAVDEPLGTVVPRLADDAARYNGFNLLACDARAMWIVSSPGDPAPKRVEPGFHGLSNARLDTSWPKVDRAVAALREALARSSDVDDLIARAFDLLADERTAPDATLPRTGVPIDVERSLSATFIRMPGYGTRASTILIVDRQGRATFVERRFEPDLPPDERRFDFAWGDG